MTNTIAQLVARVEAASGPDRELMLEAFNVANPVSMCWDFDEGEAHSRKLHRFAALLDAEAWLDAAMTLVPEGRTRLCDNTDGREIVELYPHGPVEEGQIERGGHPNSPALALVAACLKAHDGGNNGN